ncbi:GMP reductase [Frankliniella fusca]|uniref:GMP reductase n=1 Tax=Frankliniella fusca TaxID=407009 RepID=A0AAE1HCU1_9NEOP|nr:GMP reductase [Frankliniella fusca]
MKTKNVFLLIILLALTSSLFVIFSRNQQASIQTIVSETHKHLNKLKQLKENLNQPDEKRLLASEKHLFHLGFGKNSHIYPSSLWTNTSVPAVVTYVKSHGHEKYAIAFLRNVQHFLPNSTVLIYNLGLNQEKIQTILNHCDNSRCMVLTFSLESFPSHVSDDVSHAYRPLIIQDALNRVGGVFFLECNIRLTKSPKSFLKMPISSQKGHGIIAWATRQATSSLTHPNMFGYFHTTTENFLFQSMVEANKLLIYNTADIHNNIMLPWVQCALTEECIFPIGAQSSGCHFNKKPQYRYSGCHRYDASALNIVLGLQFDFKDDLYTYHSNNQSPDEAFFKTVSDTDILNEFNALEDNSTTLSGFR